MTYYKGAMVSPVVTLRRSAGLLALLLHLGMGVAAVSLEAVALGHADVTHVERGDRGPCAPSHDESHCQICQTGTLRAAPVRVAPTFHVPRGIVAVADPEPIPPSARAPVGPHQPRAPPTASV